jgi:hypothetical protein
LTGNVEGAGNGCKAFGPAGEDLLFTAIDMQLDAVAVVFDFVNPLVPFGVFGFRVASWGLMNPGISKRLITTQLTKSPPKLSNGGQCTRTFPTNP